MANSAIVASKNILNCGKNDFEDSRLLNVFPGEHYRFLNAFVKVTKAKNIVEIGTFTGMGTLALKDKLSDVKVSTFDIIPWNKSNVSSRFIDSDFGDNLIQVIGDLSKDDVFN